MEGTIALAPRIAAPRIVERVLGGIPPSDRQVEAAGEGHGVVDHHQLLVMAGADRQHVVEADRYLGRCRPVELERRQRLALEGGEQIGRATCRERGCQYE